MTAVGVPRMVIGTHSGVMVSPSRPVSRGQAERSSLRSNQRVRPCRTAGRPQASRPRSTAVPGQAPARAAGGRGWRRRRGARPGRARRHAAPWLVTSRASSSVSPMSSAPCTSRRNACCSRGEHLRLARLEQRTLGHQVTADRAGRGEEQGEARHRDVDAGRQEQIGERRPEVEPPLGDDAGEQVRRGEAGERSQQLEHQALIDVSTAWNCCHTCSVRGLLPLAHLVPQSRPSGAVPPFGRRARTLARSADSGTT